jgi:hypothetical protein
MVSRRACILYVERSILHAKRNYRPIDLYRRTCKQASLHVTACMGGADGALDVNPQQALYRPVQAPLKPNFTAPDAAEGGTRVHAFTHDGGAVCVCACHALSDYRGDVQRRCTSIANPNLSGCKCIQYPSRWGSTGPSPRAQRLGSAWPATCLAPTPPHLLRPPFFVVANTRAYHRKDSRLYGLVEGNSSSPKPAMSRKPSWSVG